RNGHCGALHTKPDLDDETRYGTTKFLPCRRGEIRNDGVIHIPAVASRRIHAEPQGAWLLRFGSDRALVHEFHGRLFGPVFSITRGKVYRRSYHNVPLL